MEYPKLRHVEAFPLQDNGQQFICLRDPGNFAAQPLILSPAAFYIVSLFNGRNSLVDIQAEFMRRYGQMIFGDKIEEIMRQADEHLFLESERFIHHKEKIEKEYLDSPLRPLLSSLRGMKPDPASAWREMEACFLGEDGPGLPRDDAPLGNLLGAVVPHIDYRRGGICYGWGYKAIVEGSGADIFVILGTNHFGQNEMFTLTAKDFETPFGVVPTDREFIADLKNRVDFDLFCGEFDHRNEHSIELQATFLHGLFHKKRSVRIVPILCGALPPPLDKEDSPSRIGIARDFFQALKETVREREGRVFLLAAADLSHMGPQFGDNFLMTDNHRRAVEQEDRSTLRYVEALDAEGFYRNVMMAGNQRKICGLFNIYALMNALEEGEGKLLHYGQWPDENGTVTFASVVFLKP